MQNQTETTDLFTASDVAKVRTLLLKEQQGKCAGLGIVIPKDRTAVLDHNHFVDDQFVRGVLERECNAMLGVVENAHKRFLSYWLPTPLPIVLRALASYLERSSSTPDTRWRHPSWRKKLLTKFNKLKTQEQDSVLQSLGCAKRCTNATMRKKEFDKLLKDRNLGYTIILNTLTKGA